MSAPFVVQNSANFLENDGRWSTFNFRIGTGPNTQNIEAVVSTSGFDTWVPNNDSCTPVKYGPPIPYNCSATRGLELRNGGQSTGYDGSDTSTGGVSLQKLELGGLNITDLFGDMYEDQSTGASWTDFVYMLPASEGISALKTADLVPVLGVQSWFYYLSTFGLGVGVHGDLGTNGDMRSPISGLAKSGAIPGRGWGYTAGAFYGESIYIHG